MDVHNFIHLLNSKYLPPQGIEPWIFGLRDRRLTTWPLRQISVPTFGYHQFLFFRGFFFFMAETIKKKKSMAAVGFEPTPPKRLVP